jgi:LysM repeat protein
MLLTACERPLASNDSEMAEQAAEATAVAETAEAETVDQEEAEAGSASDEDAAQDDQADEAGQTDEANQADGADDVADEAESSDPDVGGGTPDTAEEDGIAGETEADEVVAEEETAADAPSQEADTEEAETEDTASDMDSEVAEQTDATEEESDSTSSEAVEEEEAAEVEDSEAEEMAAEEQAAVESSTTLPATHTVQPGENLYRIGLQYGMSWVTLAAYNHLPNANYIRVGHVLQIPGGTPSPVPPPTTPDQPGYTNYVVQRGDTLNSIAQKFGVSWVEIAEANGIVNPNLIYAGQVLKIPSSQPEAPATLTHTVKPGETLFRISLQYGVSWLAIAQANNIVPPYVIYPGQVLVIPGS